MKRSADRATRPGNSANLPSSNYLPRYSSTAPATATTIATTNTITSATTTANPTATTTTTTPAIDKIQEHVLVPNPKVQCTYSCLNCGVKLAHVVCGSLLEQRLKLREASLTPTSKPLCAAEFITPAPPIGCKYFNAVAR